MFNVFKFAKPKTPGYGLSKNFYLTVLAARANLPAIASVINPKGEGGAVSGYGVPLAAGCSKDDLHIPMARGAYAIASLDRKTVLRCLVISKEEAGFEPLALANSQEACAMAPELLERIKATWTLIQLCFESHHPQVSPSLAFLLQISHRLGFLTDGAVADPISKRYCLPEHVVNGTDPSLIDAGLHIAVRHHPDGNFIKSYTLGLQKFGLPELEIPDVHPDHSHISANLLTQIAQRELDGNVLAVGDRIGPKSDPFFVAEGGLDRGRWDGIQCFDLLPPKGKSVNEVLASWTNSR